MLNSILILIGIAILLFVSLSITEVKGNKEEGFFDYYVYGPGPWWYGNGPWFWNEGPWWNRTRPGRWPYWRRRYHPYW